MLLSFFWTKSVTLAQDLREQMCSPNPILGLVSMLARPILFLRGHRAYKASFIPIQIIPEALCYKTLPQLYSY